MNMKISSKNLHLLLPSKVTGVAKLYAEDHSCSILEAMRRFYATKLYKNLAIEATKLFSGHGELLAHFPIPGYEGTVLQTEGRLITITLSAIFLVKYSHFQR